MGKKNGSMVEEIEIIVYAKAENDILTELDLTKAGGVKTDGEALIYSNLASVESVSGGRLTLSDGSENYAPTRETNVIIVDYREASVPSVTVGKTSSTQFGMNRGEEGAAFYRMYDFDSVNELDLNYNKEAVKDIVLYKFNEGDKDKLVKIA